MEPYTSGINSSAGAATTKPARILSERVCHACGLIGAEFLSAHNRSQAFCDENCVRAQQGVPSIGEELFGSREVLCGSDIASGEAGFCGACGRMPAAMGVSIEGAKQRHYVGVCETAECRATVESRGFSDVQQTAAWLGRLTIRVKPYAPAEGVSVALSLWARNAGADQMREVFDAMARKGLVDFDVYDQFTTLARAATRAVAASSSPLEPNGMISSPENQARLAAAPFDPRRTARLLTGMYQLYNRLHQQDQISGRIGYRATLPHNARRDPKDGKPKTRDEWALHEDVARVWGELAVKHGLGGTEAERVLSAVLFAQPPEEYVRVAAQHNQAMRDAMGVQSMRDGIEGAVDPAKSSLEWFKRQARSGGSGIDLAPHPVLDAMSPIGEELEVVKSISLGIDEELASSGYIDEMLTYALFVAIFRKRRDKKVQELLDGVVRSRRNFRDQLKRLLNAEIADAMFFATARIEGVSRDIASSGSIPSSMRMSVEEARSALSQALGDATNPALGHLAALLNAYESCLQSIDARDYARAAAQFVKMVQASNQMLMAIGRIDATGAADAISSELSAGAQEPIEGPLDWLKSKGRKLRDAYQGVTTSKPYSISSLELPTYQLFLVNQPECLPSDQVPPALQLDTAIAEARKVTDAFALGRLRSHGYDEQSADVALRTFRQAAQRELQAAYDRKESTNRVRRANSNEFQRVCGRRSGPGAAGFGQLMSIPSSIGKQFGSMAAYFFDVHVEGRAARAVPKAGQTYTTNQANVLTDLRALFSQMSASMGSENALSLLKSLLSVSDVAPEFRAGADRGLKTACIPTADDPSGKCASLSQLGQQRYSALPMPPPRDEQRAAKPAVARPPPLAK